MRSGPAACPERAPRERCSSVQEVDERLQIVRETAIREVPPHGVPDAWGD